MSGNESLSSVVRRAAVTKATRAPEAEIAVFVTCSAASFPFVSRDSRTSSPVESSLRHAWACTRSVSSWPANETKRPLPEMRGSTTPRIPAPCSVRLTTVALPVPASQTEMLESAR